MNDYHSKYFVTYKNIMCPEYRKSYVMAENYEDAWSKAFSERKEDEIVFNVNEVEYE